VVSVVAGISPLDGNRNKVGCGLEPKQGLAAVKASAP
jgi:hypothetical protein